MLSNILPNPLDPLAVSVPHKQRGIPRAFYSSTYWNVAPERGPEPTRTLPPISELIASLSLSEPPRTETVAAIVDRTVSPRTGSIGSTIGRSTPTTLPSILELSLPNPHAHRRPATAVKTAGLPGGGKVPTPPTKTNVPIPTGGGGLYPPVSADRGGPPKKQPNDKKRVTTVQQPPTKRQQPSQIKTESVTPDSSVLAKPRRIQGQRNDLILAKRVKPVVAGDTAANSIPGLTIIEEKRDSEVEGKGWSTDGQEHETERNALPMRDKKQRKKRRTMSDPYPLVKGEDKMSMTPRKEGTDDKESALSTTGSKTSEFHPRTHPTHDFKIIELGQASQKQSANSSVVPHKREDKRGRRRDLFGWRD